MGREGEVDAADIWGGAGKGSNTGAQTLNVVLSVADDCCLINCVVLK